jgi:phosphoribosylamine---glycine ligase
MKVLVIGSGGREHALVWKLAQSPMLSRLYCAPGNAGTAEQAENVPIHADDIASLLAFARDSAIDFTVVGPEFPLALGIVDRFRQEGLAIFGPTQQAAALESSKVFAKTLMAEHGIPTAPFQTFSDPRQRLCCHCSDDAGEGIRRGWDSSRHRRVSLG